MDALSPENARLPERPLFVCVLGNTETAYIEGLSAAGKTAKLTDYTPAGDAEVLHKGTIIDVPILPMTPPFDTPTPALITRAALTMAGVPLLIVNADSRIFQDPVPPTPGESSNREVRTVPPVRQQADLPDQRPTLSYFAFHYRWQVGGPCFPCSGRSLFSVFSSSIIAIYMIR